MYICTDYICPSAVPHMYLVHSVYCYSNLSQVPHTLPQKPLSHIHVFILFYFILFCEPLIFTRTILVLILEPLLQLGRLTISYSTEDNGSLPSSECISSQQFNMKREGTMCLSLYRVWLLIKPSLQPWGLCWHQ